MWISLKEGIGVKEGVILWITLLKRIYFWFKYHAEVLQNCHIYDRLWYESFSTIHTTLLWESTTVDGNNFKFIKWIHVFLKFWIIWFCQWGSRHHRLSNWKNRFRYSCFSSSCTHSCFSLGVVWLFHQAIVTEWKVYQLQSIMNQITKVWHACITDVFLFWGVSEFSPLGHRKKNLIWPIKMFYVKKNALKSSDSRKSFFSEIAVFRQ